MKTLALIEKSKYFWFLLTTTLLFFFLRFPSLFEPYWYGDEGIYQTIGLGLQQGRFLYRDIWDNKPPLLYILYALFYSDQFTVRFVSLFFGIAAIIVFFFLAKKLFVQETAHEYSVGKNRNIVMYTTFLFAFLFGIPLLEGNIANSENFMLFPTLLSAFLFVHTQERTRIGFTLLGKTITQSQQLIFAGFLLGIAFLFKAVAVFDIAAFGLFFLITRYTSIKHIPSLLSSMIPIIKGFLIPIFPTILFFILNGAVKELFRATFVQNVGYVGYGNAFLIPQGFLMIKLLVLAIITILLFTKRKTLHATALFIFLWFSFSVFNAFFSGRPYTHYLLVLLPSFCLMIGLMVWQYQYRKYLALFMIIFLLILKNFTFYGKTISYYQNFISFINNKKSVSDYQKFFDGNTPKDYEIAGFIKSHTTPKDQIFLWGNNAQVYAMTNKLPPGRYTVAYHITASNDTLKETETALYTIQPKYIIINQKQGLPFRMLGYTYKITMSNHIIYERIY